MTRGRRPRGEGAGEAVEQKPVQEGERRVVHWLGPVQMCVCGIFSANDPRALRDHMRRKHKEVVAVLESTGPLIVHQFLKNYSDFNAARRALAAINDEKIFLKNIFAKKVTLLDPKSDTFWPKWSSGMW